MSKRLIDANELISAMYYYEHNEGGLTAYDAQDIINKAPTIEPKRGEWIPCTKSGLPLTELMRREGQKWYGYRCSNCNHIYKGNALTDCNFCPNCGADMREREGE